MHLIINDSSKKKTVIFIHGFGKRLDDWNITKSGKHIGIEEQIRKFSNTVLVQIEDNDYKQPISIVAAMIYQALNDLTKTNITVVGHSYGTLYALWLAENHNIDRILLIEPVIKSPIFLEYLQSKAKDKDFESIEAYKVRNYDTMPTGENLKNRVTVRIHIRVEDKPIPNLPILNSLTNKNVKSRLIIHYQASHMIHYELSSTIVDSIKDLQ